MSIPLPTTHTNAQKKMKEIAESRSLIKITSKNDANNPKSRDKRLMTKDGYIQIGYLLLHQ